MKINELISKLQALAPEAYQAEWDNSGVQVAGTATDAGRLAVALDPLPGTIAKALDWGAQVILTHHPLYMKPQDVSREGNYLDVLRLLLPAGAWLYAAHTSLDTRPGGPSFWLGEALKLRDRRMVEPAHSFGTLEVSFFAGRPLSEEDGRELMEKRGALSVYQSESGQVQLVCERSEWPGIKAMIESGPSAPDTDFYVRVLEEPARKVGYGEIGELPEAVDWAGFTALLDAALFKDGGRTAWSYCGPEPKSVRTVAYCGGSGSSMAERAFALGADVFVTGDVKYHAALETTGRMVDVGHFSLEEEMMRRMATELAYALPGVNVRFFEGEDPFRFHLPGK